MSVAWVAFRTETFDRMRIDAAFPSANVSKIND